MIRILLVEDDPEKLGRVLKTLEAVPGCSLGQIDSARDANDARRFLRHHQYDLMILDISLPDRPDKIPTHDGGIKLLEEVLDRDVYLRPREVVGLTAYSEVLKDAGRRFADDLWLVVQYDPTTDTWSEQLQRKVRHILLAKRSGSKPDYSTYLCVVTAMYDPELTALLTLNWNWASFEVPNDPTVYHRGHFMKNGEKQEVIAASAPRMGMTATAVLSTKMISAFRPRYMAMTGILAGVKGNCSLGDIVVADPSWDWGSGKYQVDGDGRRFAVAPYQIGLNSFVRGKISLLSNDAAALESIRGAWQGTRLARAPLRLHLGPVASGASVLADPEMTTAIIQQHRKLVGIEMETYGLFAAAEECPLPQPRAFSIKSVADFADTKKGDTHQEYAAYTSIMGLKEFVEKFL